MNLASMEYKDDTDWTRTDAINGRIYDSENYSGWYLIGVKCDEVDNIIYINAMSEGYMEWAME